MPAILLALVKADPETLDICNQIKQKFPDASGIIIALFKMPKEGIEAEDDFSCTDYWGDMGWESLNSETHSENPHIYNDEKAASRKMAQIFEEFPELNMGLAFWFHPDAKTVPLTKYKKMRGGRFPGSPRR